MHQGTLRVRRFRAWVLCLGLLFILASSATAAGGAVDELGAPVLDANRTWTIVMYFCADNNLEAPLLSDLNEIENALPEKGVDVVVLVDRAKGFTDADGDWTGARVYRLRPDKDPKVLGSELLADCGEVNMGDQDILARFVGAALKAYPAKHYAVVMSDHGAGWSDNCNDDSAPGAKDDYDELSLPETVGGLQAGLRAAGVKKLDLLTFDMCLMAQLEVAVACRELADVMLACESLGPGYGIPFEDVLAEFATETDVGSLATKLVDSFGKSCERHGDEEHQLSAVDLARILPVRDALNAAAEKLLPVAGDEWAAMSRSMFFSETFNGRVEYRHGKYAKACFDMVDILGRCQANCATFPAGSELDALKTALDASLIASYRGTSRRLSRGLSVYAPVREDNMKPVYADEAGTKDWAWRRLLVKLHELQGAHATKPKIANTSVFGPDNKPAEAIVPLTGGYCTFDLEGTNVLWLTLDFSHKMKDGSYGVLFKTFHVAPGLGRRTEDTAAAAIDLLVPVYPDGKTTLGQELGGIQFALWAGGKVVPATVEVIDPENPTLATVYALLEEGAGKDQDLPLEIQFNTDDWKVGSVVAHFPRPDGGFSTANVTLKPAAKVTPLMETETTDGKIRNVGMDTFVWGDGPELIMQMAPPGEHALFVKAEAISGLSSYKGIPYRVVSNATLDAYLAGRDKLAASDLHGSWALQSLGADPKTKAVTFSPADVSIEIKPNPKNASDMLYSATIEGQTIQGVARFDARGLPMLNFYVENDKGRLVRVKAYVAIAQKSNGCDTVILKNLGIEEDAADIQRLVRPGDVGKVKNTLDSDNGGGDERVTLVGTWANDEGVVLKIEASRYVMEVGGEPYDRGAYTVAGKKIYITSDSGEKEAVDFILAGRTLTIVDSDGIKTVLQRVR